MKKFNLSKGLLVGLLTLALCFTMFGVVKASAEEASEPNETQATYVPEHDGIYGTGTVYVYVLKNASGNTIKASDTATKISTNVTKPTALTDLGIKGTKKDVYLYCVDKAYTEDKTGVSANLIIKGQAASKITGAVDYTKVDALETDAAYYQVLSATCLDSTKKDIKEPAPVIYWSTEADGKYYRAYLSDAEVTDGLAESASDTAKALVKNAFTTKILNKMLSDGGGTIYVKQLGLAGEENVRTSSAVKVKIAKLAKAPGVKLDATKNTLALKNGFDFGYAYKEGSKQFVAKWFTILPVLKGAATKTADDSIVPTSSYLPVSKKDTTAKLAKNDEGREDGTIYKDKVSYTSYKFKSIGLDFVVKAIEGEAENIKTATATSSASGDIVNNLEDLYGQGYLLAVRKSATEKKPASEATFVTIAAKTEAPLVLTESCVSGQYIVSKGTDFAKGLYLGTIKNFPGYAQSGEDTSTKELLVKGFNGLGGKFEIGKPSDGMTLIKTTKDSNAEAYEYAVVKAENIKELAENAEDDEKNAQIDWSTVAWKKLDPAKTKITSKLKTKYSTIGGSKVEATLTAVTVDDDKDLMNSADVPHTSSDTEDDPSILLLVRRAGIKGKTASDAVIGSDYVKLYVVQQGKDYYIMSYESVGDAANYYNIRFLKWGEDENGNKKYVEDESLAQKGFVAPSGSGQVTVAKQGTTFDYKVSSSLNNKASISGEETKMTISGLGDGEACGSFSGDILVREYAKIKVVVKYGSISGETGTKDYTVIDTTSSGKVGLVTSNSGGITVTDTGCGFYNYKESNDGYETAIVAADNKLYVGAKSKGGTITPTLTLDTENYDFEAPEIPENVADFIEVDKNGKITIKDGFVIESSTPITATIQFKGTKK